MTASKAMQTGRLARLSFGGLSFGGFTLALSLALSGCVSLGVEVPDSLLTLTPAATAPAGTSAEAGGEGQSGAIAVLTPEVPAKLDVLRVPVNVSQTEIAYIPDAFWVEKPARLFRRVLGESLRVRASETEMGAVILDSDDTPLRAATFLRGNLIELGYDAPTGSVVVRYDAVRSDAKGEAVTRRFEAREDGVEADAAAIGPALNRAVNAVAGDVAQWMMP